MKKLVIVLSVLVVLLVGGLAATLVIFLPNMQNPNTTQAVAVSQPSTIAGLEAGMPSQPQRIASNETTYGAAGTAYAISSQQAEDIAIAFVGYGTVEGTMLFTENGVYTFEVDIRHGDGRYTVFVNAENGNVTQMSRYDYAGAGFPLTDAVPNYPAHQPDTGQQQGVPNYPAHQPDTVQHQGVPNYPAHQPDTVQQQGVPNYPAHQPVQPAVPVAPTEQQSAPAGGGAAQGGAATPGSGAPPSPGGSASPSPGGSASPSPGGWSSPSPGGWSSPSPANPRWTGTGGREWTWGT